MKKIFSLLAVFAMAVSSAWAQGAMVLMPEGAITETQLIALIGDDTFECDMMFTALRLFVSEGHVVTSVNGGPTSRLMSDSDYASKTSNGYEVDDYEFYVSGEHVSKVVFSFMGVPQDMIKQYLEGTVDALVGYMGNKVYISSSSGKAIKVIEGVVCLLDGETVVKISEDHTLQTAGDRYLLRPNEGSQYAYSFSVNSGTILSIYCSELGSFNYGAPVGPIGPGEIEVTPAESALAALMGTTKYVTSDETSIYVNADGRIEIMWGGDPSQIGKMGGIYTISAESDGNYKAQDVIEGMNYFLFHVAEGKVTKVEEFYEDEVDHVYLPEGEEEIPTDITDVEIVKPSLSKTIKVLKNGKIVIIKNGVTYDLNGSVTE